MSTKFLAIGTSKPMALEQRGEHMLAEVSATLQLYLDGKVDQFWHRYDGKGVIEYDVDGGGDRSSRGAAAGGRRHPELRVDTDRLRPTAALLEAARPAGA